MPTTRDQAKDATTTQSRRDDFRDAGPSAGVAAPSMPFYTDDLVPKFSGQDGALSAARWAQDVEENAAIFGWTPLQQLIVGRRSLIGTAGLWLRSETAFKTWEDLKAALLKEFPDTVDAKTIHEMMSARKKRSGESCLDYLLVMRELGKRGKMADYVAIKYIIEGIQDVETNKIMLYGAKTYGDLKEKIKIYEAVKQKIDTEKKASRSTLPSHYVSPAPRPRYRERAAPRRCYSCGEERHVSAECPYKQQGLKCFKCNGFGHISTQCHQDRMHGGSGDVRRNNFIGCERGDPGVPTQQQQYRQPQTQYGPRRAMFASEITDFDGNVGNTVGSNMASTNDVSRDSAVNVSDVVDRDVNKDVFLREIMTKKPEKGVKILDEMTSALIDTGSEVNLMSEELYRAIGSPNSESEILTLSGLGQMKVRSVGKITVPVMIDGQEYCDVVFHIVPTDSMPYKLIIGQEFLRNVTMFMNEGNIMFLPSCEDWFRNISCFVTDIPCVVGYEAPRDIQQQVTQMVENYRPEKEREAPIQLRIILKDDIPVAQRPRRLAISEQGEVEKQINQWLKDGIIQIHGKVNILHDLVLAFVECGRLRQARRILETPGMQTRQKRLQNACERYVQEGKSEYLEGLFEATRELSYIDRANIFYHLLVTYCKANETDKALGLWTLLQEEGEVPSEAFLTCLGSHLKAKNRPVPFAYVASETKPKVKPEARPQHSMTKKEVTEKVELLVKEGRLSEATEVALKSINEGLNPKANVLKYLVRSLAEKGDIETIEMLGSVLGGSMKRDVTYDDKLTLAVFIKGGGAGHIDTLSQEVQNAKTPEELEKALRRFPRSSALALAVNSEELVGKCHMVAEFAASRGHVLPANLLWMEYLLAGKEQEADSLWEKYLKNADLIVYRRLLQESHTRNQPQLAEKLLSSLKNSKSCTPSTLGNVYSRIINLHLSNSNTEDARLTLEKALSNGCTIENITKTTLNRLKEALETVGQEFKYAIP